MLQPLVALFAGDSITDAGRRENADDRLGRGYVRRIAERDGSRLRSINAGVSGDRTADLLARWDADVIRPAPDALTVLVGVNDMLRRYDAEDPTSIEQFRSNYVELLDRAREKLQLRHLVLMEPFIVAMDDEQRRWRTEDLDEKRAVVRELADRYSAVFVPLDSVLNERAQPDAQQEIVRDGVHPTAVGHGVIADAWWAAMEKRIPPRTY